MWISKASVYNQDKFKINNLGGNKKTLNLGVNRLSTDVFVRETSPVNSLVNPPASVPVSFGGLSAFKKIKGIPCPCCGRIMVPLADFEALSWTHITGETSAKTALKKLRRKLVKMTNNEKETFFQVEQLFLTRTKSSFNDLLELVPHKNSKLFNSVRYDKLSDEKCNKMLLQNVKKYKESLHPIEKMAYDELRLLHKKYPDKSFAQLLLSIRAGHIESLHKSELIILKKLDNFSENFSNAIKGKVKNHIDKTRGLLVSEKTSQEFKRGVFIKEIQEVIKSFHDKSIKKKFLKIADELPNSNNSYSAFVVKYSEPSKKQAATSNPSLRTSREIAQRLIMPSVSTIEHVKPKSKSGENASFNYLVECAKDNGRRSNMDFQVWLEKHPEMIKNSQIYIDKIIALINSGHIKGYNYYPALIKETLYTQSKGLIDLDISKSKVLYDSSDIERLAEKYYFQKIA